MRSGPAARTDGVDDGIPVVVSQQTPLRILALPNMDQMRVKRVAEVRDWDLAELDKAVEAGGSATPDEVSVTRDGRLLDSREAVLAFLDEANRDHAQRSERVGE